MTEVWQPVTGYEGYYEVSNMGRVRSHDRICHHKDGKITRRKGRVLNPALRAGYPFVILQKDAKREQIHVHRLVAAAFCPKPAGTNMVNHIDSDRTNNRADNLEWTTHAGNVAHAAAHKRWNPRKGEAHHAAVLTVEIVKEIKRAIIAGGTTCSLARQYGVDANTISGIKHARSWRDVAPELNAACAAACEIASQKGATHPMAKLTEDTVSEIIRLLKQQVEQKSIAAQFGVRQPAISSINLGKAWAHIRVEGCGEPPYYLKAARRGSKR